jgi:hypothetical protein
MDDCTCEAHRIIRSIEDMQAWVREHNLGWWYG